MTCTCCPDADDRKAAEVATGAGAAVSGPESLAIGKLLTYPPQVVRLVVDCLIIT